MKYCLAFLAFITPLLLNAQSSIDILTISGFYGLPANYQMPVNGKASESGGLFNLKAPIVIGEKTIWYNDLTYTLFNVNSNVRVEPVNALASMRLHAFILQTGLLQKLSEKNAIQLLVVPRYTTDFNGSNSKNWQFGMIALYEHRYKTNLLMRVGGLYNRELFGPLVTPLIYLDWQLNKKWSVIGLLPINLKINYTLNDRVTTGFSHFGFTTTYRIGQEDFKGDYIERSSIDETLFLRWKMAGNIHLETRFGYSLGRVYAHYEGDQKMDLRLSILNFGDDRIQKNVNFNSGPIASVRFVYSLVLNK